MNKSKVSILTHYIDNKFPNTWKSPESRIRGDVVCFFLVILSGYDLGLDDRECSCRKTISIFFKKKQNLFDSPVLFASRIINEIVENKIEIRR